MRRTEVANPPEACESQVLAAVWSLCQDCLRPYGRLLRKRLAERTMSSDGIPNIDVDIQRLKTTCLSCPDLDVTNEQGGDWSVLPLNLHPKCRATLVDVYSSSDPYPEDFWRAATEYFEGLVEHNMRLPGGRYSCAQALVARKLSFLAGRSLGQVCHIVQLAISRRKILGYLNGAVVPHGRSQSMVKERCAQMQRPCEGSGAGSRKVADWPAVRKCLSQIMRSIVRANGSMPLSNVKRLFRSRFQLLLSETALGHAKLSELLQDPRLSDICSVRLKGNVYLVLPPEPKKASQAVESGCKTISLVAELSLDDLGNTTQDQFSSSMPEPVLYPEKGANNKMPGKDARGSSTIDDHLKSYPKPNSKPVLKMYASSPSHKTSTTSLTTEEPSLRTVVKNTFIHMECAPAMPAVRAPRRHMTLPTTLDCHGSLWQEGQNVLDDFDECDKESQSTDSPGSGSSKADRSPSRMGTWLELRVSGGLQDDPLHWGSPEGSHPSA